MDVAPWLHQKYISTCNNTHRTLAEHYQETWSPERTIDPHVTKWKEERKQHLICTLGWRREALEAVKREWSSWSVSLDKVRTTQSMYMSNIPWPGMHAHCCAWSWEMEPMNWKAIPKWTLLPAVGRQPEGRGGRKYARWNAFGGKLDCHGTRALLLSHMQGVKPPCSLSLPTCHQLPLEGLVNTAHRVPDTGDKKAPSRVISPAPMAIDFPAHLAPRVFPKFKQLCHLHTLSPLEQTQVLQGCLRSRLLWVAHMQRSTGFHVKQIITVNVSSWLFIILMCTHC